jgi:hypothetical protein
MSGDVIKRVSERLRSNSWDVRAAIYAAALTAIFNTVYVAYIQGYEEGQRVLSIERHLPMIHGVDPAMVARNRIAGLMIVCGCGLLSRTVIGLILSALSLALAFREFVAWYYLTVVNVRPYDESVGLLASGTWWDVSVWMVASILLTWVIVTAASVISRRRV